MATFTTHESIDNGKAIRVMHSGQMEAFSPDKLYTEVLLALQDRKNPYNDAREITSTVTQQLMKLPHSPVFEARQISQAVSQVLKRFDRRCWLRYQAEHPSLQA